MLNKIIIINSALYAKAVIDFNDVTSIQLVGPNNIGKSSLVNVLNFLYIISEKQMRFEGNRQTKESLEHYFPSLEQSYIIFEVSNTAGYRCIVVKRTPENDIAYYIIPHAYDEKLFFKATRKGQEICPFNALRANLALEKITCTWTSRKQLYKTVYSHEKSKQPVLLLAKEKTYKYRKREKNFNTFAAIYKHLICSGKPSADDLTNMLIDASPLKSFKPLNVFAEKSNENNLKKIEDIEKKAQELKNSKPFFEEFKKEYNAYEEHQQILGKAHYTFQEQYPITLKKINEEIKTKKEQIQKLKQQIEEVNRQKEGILVAKGQWQNTAKQKKASASKIKEKLETIAPYTSELLFNALETKVENLELEKVRLKQALHGNNAQQKTRENLQKELDKLKGKASELTRNIENFSDSLIQHISADINIRKRLNVLLSRQLLMLPKAAIKKQVTQVFPEITLYDGKIDVSGITSAQHFIDVEELRKEKKETENQMQAIETLIKNENALKDIEREWQKNFSLLTRVREKPDLLKQQEEDRKAIKQAEEKEKQCIQEQENCKQEENAKTQLKQQHEKDLGNLTHTKEQYETWQGVIHKEQLIVEEKLDQTDLGELYQHICKAKEALKKQEERARSTLEKIPASIMPRYNKDLDHCATILQEQFENTKIINDQATMREAVFNTFGQPTKTFLSNYEELKDYIKSFSKKLAKYHISGIEAIALELEEVPKYIEGLTKISEIKRHMPLLDQYKQQEEGLDVLKKYIAQERTFKLKDLFKLRLKLKKEGKWQTLDISKQMESYGTDKVLRIFIFVMLLKQFFVHDPNNRVVIYIDEIATVDKENIQRILHLCKTHHILPIFASVEFKGWFNDYYFLCHSNENEGKIHVDKRVNINSIATAQPPIA